MSTHPLEAIEGDYPGAFRVPVAGHLCPLSVRFGPSSCGQISDGVAFEFSDQGSWVVSIQTLREIVQRADAAHDAHAERMRKVLDKATGGAS